MAQIIHGFSSGQNEGSNRRRNWSNCDDAFGELSNATESENNRGSASDVTTFFICVFSIPSEVIFATAMKRVQAR